MLALLSSVRKPFAYLAAFSLGLNLLMLVPALFMLQVFDRVLVSHSIETLYVLLLGCAVGLSMMLVLDYVRNRLQGIIGHWVGDSLVPAVLRRELECRAVPGALTSSAGMKDVSALQQLLSTQGLLALLDSPWVLAYTLLITWINPLLGLAAAVAALSMLAIAVLTDKVTQSALQALRPMANVLPQRLDEAIRNAEVLQAQGMSEALLTRWAQDNLSLASAQAGLARRSVAMSSLSRTLRQAIQIGMLGMGAYLVLTQRGTPGIMIAATMLVGRALAPVEQAIASWRLVREACIAWQRLSHHLSEGEVAAEPMPLPVPSGELQVQNVSLRSPDGTRLLINNVSVHLAPGESLAVIGPSAAGKSTLTRLLLGLWHPSAGTVRLDGTDLTRWQRTAIGPWIGYMPQDVELFDATVAENIARLGQVDSEKVVQAAMRAQVHELILSLPQGYDTAVGPGGMLLSPGQRQRVALARALYGDPRLLVLDEPNANLDGAGELALADVLRNLRGRVTVVIVTHRTGLIRSVDQILHLEDGRVGRYGPARDVIKAMRPVAVETRNLSALGGQSDGEAMDAIQKAST